MCDFPAYFHCSWRQVSDSPEVSLELCPPQNHGPRKRCLGGQNRYYRELEDLSSFLSGVMNCVTPNKSKASFHFIFKTLRLPFCKLRFQWKGQAASGKCYFTFRPICDSPFGNAPFSNTGSFGCNWKGWRRLCR